MIPNLALAEETERVRLDLDTLRQGIRALLESRAPGRYWVAEIEGRVVGQLLITFEWSDWRNRMVLWIGWHCNPFERRARPPIERRTPASVPVSCYSSFTLRMLTNPGGRRGLFTSLQSGHGWPAPVQPSCSTDRS